MEQPTDIFLSYAREDLSRIEPLIEALQRLGWSVYWDQAIAPGTAWRDTIDRALAQANVVLVVWSQHSIDSHWVREEAQQGLDRRALIPVMLEDVEPPLGFRSIQVATIQAWDSIDDDPGFRSLVESISTLLVSPIPEQSPPRPAKRLPVPLLFGYILGTVTILAGLGWWLTSDSETTYRRVFYEGFDLALEDGSSVWQIGRRAGTAWEGSVQNGSHSLCNVDQDASASFTNRLAYDEEGDYVDQRNARVSARVALEPPFTQYSAAGLLYRSSEDRPDYFAFVLTPGNTVSLFRRTADSLRIEWSAELPARTSDQVLSLAMSGAGSVIRLYADDSLVHEVADVDLLSGDPGIFAYSTGCFLFDDVAVFHPLSE